MIFLPSRITLLSVLAVLFVSTASPAQGSEGVRITDDGQTLRVETASGTPFTTYHYRLNPRPVFHPVLGAAGESVVRSWPLGPKREGEATDHPHHKGMWFTHGAVNGVDFWLDDPGSGKKRAGRIVHQEFVDKESFKDGVFTAKNHWVAPSGLVVCTDTRRHRFRVVDGRREMDFTVTLHAERHDVVIGDTKEGTFALRLHPALRLNGAVAKGSAINAEGITGKRVWGKRSPFVAYFGPVNGVPTLVAIFDHPKNHGHPTYWHARDYGLFAANPFGAHDFAKLPVGSGDLTIKKGQSLTLHYRVVFATGDPQSVNLAALMDSFAATDVAPLP